MGSLTIGTGTKLVNGNKSITHTASSTANPKTWTFTWHSPVAGSGNVTFYGAIVVAKANTKLCTLVVHEDTGVGIQELGLQLVKMYPNPCTNALYVTGLNAKSDVNLYSVDGRFVKNLYSGMAGQTEKIEISGNTPAGIYLVELKSGNERKVEKLIIQ